MNCSRCGTNLPDNVVFCPNCGNPNPDAPPPNGYAPPIQGQIPGNYAPQGAYGPLPPRKIQDYLIWSIISTLCCCLPLGIAAIIYSVQCKSAIGAGQYDLAVKHSNTAFYCNLISLIAGFIINIIVVAIQTAALQAQNGGGF